MRLIPKYQNSGMIAQRDNTNVKVSSPFDKLSYTVPLETKKSSISQDNRTDWQRNYDKKAGEREYNKQIASRNEEKGLRALNGFLELTDYAGLVTGAGGLVGGGLKLASKQIGRHIFSFRDDLQNSRMFSKGTNRSKATSNINNISDNSSLPIGTHNDLITKEFFDNDFMERARRGGNQAPSHSKDWYDYDKVPEGSLGDKVVGIYHRNQGRVKVSNADNATRAHEFRHKMDDYYPLDNNQEAILNDAYKVYDNTSYRWEGSKSVSEKMATNTELRRTLYDDFTSKMGRNPSVDELNSYIDQVGKKELSDRVSVVNDYGADYFTSIVEHSKTIPKDKHKELSDTWIKNIKTAIKTVPVLAPFLQNNQK